MPEKPDDLCPRPAFGRAVSNQATRPLVEPIQPSSVYECQSPQQALELLTGQQAGYIYSRDTHPNADSLAEKCRALHGAERAAIASSGMAAIALAMLSQLDPGDHILGSRHLYGRSLQLLNQEARRIGLDSSAVDTNDLQAVRSGCTPRTRLIVVETISNPVLRVADIAALAEIAHRHNARLLVDNTFASPVLCRPLEHGADLVHESVTKIINGHSDVMLGMLCGSEQLWERIPFVLSCWGFTPSPFDCWLASRGLGTLHLRVERTAANALSVAEFLTTQKLVEKVHYPGLPSHPDHQLARRQLSGGFGAMVAFTLRGGRPAADKFIAASKNISFCPSLGDLSTTLSHPQTTSHRGLTDAQLAELEITGGTIRLSVGTESPEFILQALQDSLRQLTG